MGQNTCRNLSKVVNMKYQTGIQESVFRAIKKAEKLGLPYITKDQIIEEVQRNMELRKPSEQVGQALYQLQREGKFVKKRIEKVKIPSKEQYQPEDEYYQYGWVPVKKSVNGKTRIFKELIEFVRKQTAKI